MRTAGQAALKAWLLLICLLLPAWGQEPAPLVRSNSRLVLLDIVVTGKDGNPIRGLTQNDFSVLENGVPQKITSFEASSVPGSTAQSNPARNLILLDELNVRFSDLAFARDRIAMFLERNEVEKYPTCLMAVGMHGLVMVQEFSQDRKLLNDKLRHLPPVDANPKTDAVDNDLAEQHAKASLEALTQIARAAVGSPYSLNVIWITSGFPGLVQTASSNDRVDAGLRSVANFLIRSRMRLYTIDPAGVVPLADPAQAAKTGRGSTRDAHSSSASQIMNSTHGEAMTADVLLRHMTRIMGGLSYRGRNDVEEALTQAIEDGASSYLVSYSPSNDVFDGGYRSIQVNVAVPGAAARTRQGYYASPEDFQPDRQVTDVRVDNALSSVVPYGALNVSCPAAYDGRNNRLTGKIVVTPGAVRASDQKEQVIRVASFSKDHKLLDNWVWRVNWKNPWTNREVAASFDKLLSPKANMVRFVVADPAADRIGTCEYRIQ